MSSIAQEMKEIMLKKNTRRLPDKNQRNVELNQLITKKVNFGSSRGNQSQSNFNKEQIVVGPGGFVMPKMYQLNVSEL